MVLDGRGPDRGWQEDDSEGGSSSRTNDVSANPPNYPNDPSLTGSSSHGSRPQGSGPTISLHVQDPPPVLYDQHSYHLASQSGPTLPNQFPRAYQNDFTQTWPNNQITDTWTAVDTNRYYHPMHYTSGDAPVANTRHSVDRSSPFYSMEPPNNTTVQPRHQQRVLSYSSISYPGDRRPSFPQVHAPIPHQPTDYASLPSPPRSNSSYSNTGLSPQRLGHHIPLPVVTQWPPPPGRSNRSASNSTHPHSSADSRSPVYFPDVIPPGSSSQASHFVSFAQLPSYSGETSSYPPYPPNNDPGDGPSFPVPQPAPPPAPAKRKRMALDHPNPQSDQQTQKRVRRSGEQSVASGSGVTSDMLRPRAPRGSQDGESQTIAQARDAERKKNERAELKGWFERIANLFPSSRSDPKPTRLHLLNRVIEHLGGTRPDPVSHPEKANTPKGRSSKSHTNAVRTHNENRAYNRIRELLQAGGRFNVTQTTSHLNLLQIAVYVLSERSGVVDEELAEIISKLLNHSGFGTF